MGLRTLLGLKKQKILAYLNESYSQEGEDSILHRLFENEPLGYFVDVGAHHPIKYSNTYKFYKRGWRGLNIDAMPGSMDAFKLLRPEDVNLEMPVSDEEKEMPFFIFNEPALNTFSWECAKESDGRDHYKIERIANIKTNRLDNILDLFLPPGQNINFLTVDAEGYDHKILLSNNWAKYRPRSYY